MGDPLPNQEDEELYEECLKKAEGNKARALTYYNHRRTAAANELQRLGPS